MPNTFHKTIQSRIQSFQKYFLTSDVDGFIFTNIFNIRYLTGFTGSDGVVVMSPEDIILMVDGRYTTQASIEANPISLLQYQNKIQGIKEAIERFGFKRVGFEASCMSVETFNELSVHLKNVTLCPFSDQLRHLRAIKDDQEVAIMKKAAAIASKAIKALLGEITIGWTEQEAALQLEINARQAGAEQIAFETIMASGLHAALPHAKPTNRPIQKGDVLLIDFGVRYQGYCSDESCTIAFGELTRDQKNAYRSVKKAHDEAIAALEAGMPASDVDTVVRRVLGEKYVRNFVHGTGHGVGLEVHEAPRLAPNSPDILHEGMVVTIEPGVYYPGLWGIRIEDTVIIKEKGCEKITKMNKKLTVLE